MNTNLEALINLVIVLCPETSSFSWYAKSSPSFELAAQNLKASAPYFSNTACGSTTLPFDFDIFSPFGSSTQPDIATSFHGFTLLCSWLFTNVLNSQNEIISCACGLSVIGYNLS